MSRRGWIPDNVWVVYNKRTVVAVYSTLYGAKCLVEANPTYTYKKYKLY